MNRWIKHLLLVLFSIGALVSCDDIKSTNPSKLRAEAVGNDFEMLIVVDTTLWSKEVGEALRETFAYQFPGVAQEELMFKIAYIDPPLVTTNLRRHRNLVYVYLTDRATKSNGHLAELFSDSTIAKIRRESGMHFHVKPDQFANDQTVMYLFSKNEETLVAQIREQQSALRLPFVERQRKYLKRSLYENGYNEALEKSMMQKHKFSMRIPSGYLVAKDEGDGNKGVMHLRYPEAKYDKNILISYEPYTDVAVFDLAKAIDYRDTVCRRHLFANPEKKDTYIKTERKEMEVITEEINFNGAFATSIRGAWKTNAGSVMGGPFLGYIFVDEARQRVFYIEGLVYAPGEEKRKHLLELETIISTFGT